VTSNGAVSASFRDPSGFMFTQDGELYRQVNVSYKDAFDLLSSSGLQSNLTSRGLLIPHEEVSVSAPTPETAYKIIKPERLPFISYPYEWCFSELKDAALATLDIQNEALKHGMTLKDASAYNIQFRDTKPVFIDTLSFDPYHEGEPWVAYRQFCQHFLAPLALMANTDVRLGQLSRIFIDGVPLDMAKALLPWKTRLNMGLLIHIHLHAKSQSAHADDGREGKAPKAVVAGRKLSRQSLLGILDSLRSAITKLEWKPAGTEWGDYYEDTNYSSEAMDSKHRLVSEFLGKIRPSTVWDLGANTGVFSRLASELGAFTVSYDIDPAAVEKNYRESRAKQRKNLLPLMLDLTNPSPSIGWDNTERESLAERGPADAVLALALIHHLAIGNNVPLPKTASFFSKVARSLIIEFVPKSDSQVRRLLASREDIFPDYDSNGFERAYSPHFTIEEKREVKGSERILYLMRRK
jgi:hypothetical protein